MSSKRSRSTFETDLHAPYAVFGTPLPGEAEARDDGSFVPVWKQEVRDERGRRRLHGAFTGGWSAGYFNTVSTKEGWTPSNFSSSRTNRNKDKDGAPSNQQRPEDYMDEEDLADAAEAQMLQTTQSFAGLGSSKHDEARAGGLTGLFRTGGDTMGLKLLRKMGWKDGQGIGPKVRRSARLDTGTGSAGIAANTYLFAPDDVDMIRFTRKTDRRGLGCEVDASLGRRQPSADDNGELEDTNEDGRQSRRATSLLASEPAKAKPGRGTGMGIGILNDDGSGDDDPYEIGPRIKYNRSIGADKKKRMKNVAAASNPSLKNAPVFVPKTSRGPNGLRRCHDGRLPLGGFILARVVEDLTALLSQYAPPAIPPEWKSSKHRPADADKSTYLSTADAAKASIHDPKSRAAVLGEKALPGKSVFDFLSGAARDQLAAASGRSDLPQAKGEVPDGFALTEAERQEALWKQVPQLDRETASAAISKSSAGLYADDEGKRARYMAYLENQAHPSQPVMAKPKGIRDDDFIREMKDFYNCARIFKPMTGFMASRFTSAKTTSITPSDGSGDAETGQLVKPEPKQQDPAEQAAQMGMFGTMTRSVDVFFPTRLLCKRFNVKAPAHSGPDVEPEGRSKTAAPDPQTSSDRPAQLLLPASVADAGGSAAAKVMEETPPLVPERRDVVNPETNSAVEGKTAHADVLRAIFGDSDSE